ncbi:TetR/AcrR family transcriptional regulator [Luedemannella flava]|uniref:TetR/AcrR family transcriptional regulator n=1 Tax=Luedemannella flava TaxID=349316 RepID=UPI0031D10140
MPKVSDAHLAARRQQILDAARACFLHNGFHATSMNDVVREAGLSIGAVYRYFPSKNDLIMALAEQVIGQIMAGFDEIVATEPPLPLQDAVGRAVELAAPHTGPDGALRIAVQVWSEALRDPALAEFVHGVYTRLRARMVALAAAAVARGDLPAGSDPEAVGSVLFALLPGYALQRILIGVPDPATYRAGLESLFATAARP